MTHSPDFYDGAPRCLACADCGWVCENHSDFPWAGLADVGPCCGGAGAPCGVCNQGGHLFPHTVSEVICGNPNFPEKH